MSVLEAVAGVDDKDSVTGDSNFVEDLWEDPELEANIDF